MRLFELLSGVDILNSNISLETDITSVAYDSRKVMTNSVFVCINGMKLDGHAYMDDALNRGAAVCIISELAENEKRPYIQVADTRKALAYISANYYKNPSREFALIGVTGTNGKTTTTYLLKTILEKTKEKIGLIGTNQNMIGDVVLESERTTPESLELQQLFRQMADEGVRYVIMEVSSHALFLNRVDCCDFDIGIFTNLTQDHLDFHSTMENYLKAKTKLFTMCTAGIINLDDEAGEYILKNSTSMNFTYSIDRNDANIMAKNVRLSAKGVDFEVLTKDSIRRIELGIPGRFSVYNALGAITCGQMLGVSLEDITAALKGAKGVKGRVEVLATDTDYTVIIDYAHTPDGLYNILAAISSFATGRILTVFGCGGDRDKTKRPKMGKIAAQLSDYCVVTSDNPRSEEPMAIIDDILKGFDGEKCEYRVIESRYEAIRHALDIAKPDDIVLLAGKGHETYQVLKDKTIHFDEREVVSEILQSKI